MARSRSSKSRRKKPARAKKWFRGRLGPWIFGVVLVVLVLAIPVHRWIWRMGEANPVGEGLRLITVQGCVACHRTPEGAYRWRSDGTAPSSLDTIRDAIVNGRTKADGFPGAMPAYAGRIAAREWRSLVLAVGAEEGLVGVPEDPELAAGHDVAVQMECFGCHGRLGSGGVSNPGSLSGGVPGWYGRSFLKAAAAPNGLERILREGAKSARVPVPWAPGPVLQMPAYGDRLDSTEIQLLTRYMRWLQEHPPQLD